ncbi:MAG: hypothetical protein IIB83_09925 [Bacteroidetes bacterium]|nr:hypothetical protein [Bacteroidota bacterium]
MNVICFSGLSTDGIEIYKSSSYSVWPIFLAILNLPPSLRFKPHKLFLSTLCSGPKGPVDMNIAFKLLVKELKILYTHKR